MKKMIIIWVAVAAMVSDYVYAHSSHVQTQQENVQAVAAAREVSTDKEVAALKEVIDKQKRYIVKLNEMISSRKQEIAELKNQANSELESDNKSGLSAVEAITLVVVMVLFVLLIFTA